MEWRDVVRRMVASESSCAGWTVREPKTEDEVNEQMSGDDRARGLMVGIAAGNLLGIVQEGQSKRWVAEKYPDGVREIEERLGCPDDDDLAQALIVAEAAGRGPLDPDDLGRRFWDWAETNGRGIGNLTGHVLQLYGGIPPRCPGAWRPAAPGSTESPREPAGVPSIEASRKAAGGQRAGNGALMRCAPVAVRWRDDAAALVRNSIVSAVPTHWDRRCGWSCALANLAAAAALRGETPAAEDLLDAGVEGVRAALPELQRYGYEADVPRSVREAVRCAAGVEVDDVCADDGSMGFTLLTLRLALIALWRASGFEQGLRSIVEAGGDTDTNGAVAGALLGARFGIDAVPARWRQRIAEIRAGRTPPESYADRLQAAGEADGSWARGVIRASVTTMRASSRRGATVDGGSGVDERGMPHTTWKQALDKYRYPVNLTKFADAAKHPGWFKKNIHPGDRRQTMDFEDRFRKYGRDSLEAWDEVVFWKNYSMRHWQGTGITLAGRASPDQLWSKCADYIKNPDRESFKAFRELFVREPVVATAATFPAFVCPDKFPMVDRHITRWAVEHGAEHSYPGGPALEIECVRDLGSGVLRESHWPFVESWIEWCRCTARKLDKLEILTGETWRARDVEMAVFAAKKFGLKLKPLC